MNGPFQHVMMNYSPISEYIYVGTNSCCTDHFDQSLLRQGISADISLESNRIDAAWGIKYFLWLPTIDHTAPTLQALALGTQMLHLLVNQKIKTYVHCKNGHGRAPTLVAAYLISTGMSVDQAIKTIAKQRPEIHIEPVQKATLELFKEQVTF
jgi:hypothetical protein